MNAPPTAVRGGAVLAAALLALAALVPLSPPAAAQPRPATLTVQKGGDRTGPQAVAGLAGASFGFFADTSGSPPGPGDSPDYTCTTGADGRCSVAVPGRNGPGQGYWIRELAAPAGYHIAEILNVGAGSTSPSAYNRLFTGPVASNTTYTYPVASNANVDSARGDRWADIRDNPDLPGDCGLEIALLIDVSGSIGPFLSQVKDAANGFVDALTGTPSRIAVYRFASTASAVLPPTAVPDPASAAVVKAAINGLTASGATNWDAGLYQIAAAPAPFDSVVMLTDGNPTVYGPGGAGPGNRTRFREVENGIFSANAVKATGAKIVAVGVGAGVSGSAENLKAVSGPVEGSDYVQTDYDELAEIFRELALRTCAGTVNVVKKTVMAGGDPADAVPAGGWTFTATTGNTTPASGQTAGGSGAVSFTADLGEAETVPVTLVETLQPGYSLLPVGGQNAVCTRDGAPAPVTNEGALGFTVDAARNAIVSCTVVNRAPLPPAAVQVTKTWTVNGRDYPEPTQPADFQAMLELTGQTDPHWDQIYGGYSEGDQVTVGESVDEQKLPPGCAVTAGGDLGDHTLAAGLNTYHVTNTVECTTTLTLRKEVDNSRGGDAVPADWLLEAIPLDGSGAEPVSGRDGEAAVTGAELDPGVPYALAERDGPVGYAAEPVTCVLTGTGTAVPVPDGTLTATLGQDITCTFRNAGSAAPPGPPLPATGSRPVPLAGLGGVLLLAGLGLLAAVSRRRAVPG